MFSWLFEHIVDDQVEKCHILQHEVNIFFVFSAIRLDSAHKVEASGAIGSLSSVLSPQMLETANVEPAAAACGML